ncbi:unnamed protein product [Rodentolepis nana]|uniref:t-SNARE coiled-coil homology domain-containing protein n=1 Tax=Rodentolepis nana TaxID=102285 RepID=A0A0R3T8D0_RODNA|nr:unnamed protein product [Rodentolepis nana]
MIAFMLYHGDHLVDTLGAEINQIEESIKMAAKSDDLTRF